MKWHKCLHIVLHLITTAFILGALGLLATALVSPKWYVAYYPHSNTILVDGLWETCTYTKKGGGKDLLRLDWNCFVRDFSEDTENLTEDDIIKNAWLLIVILLLGVACIIGFVGLVLGFLTSCVHCSNHPRCLRAASIIWFIILLFATFFAVGGVIVFTRRSYHMGNRFAPIPALRNNFQVSFLLAFFAVGGVIVFTRRSYHMGNRFAPIPALRNNFQEALGMSYWLAVAGSVSFTVALLISLICVTLVFSITQVHHTAGHNGANWDLSPRTVDSTLHI